MPRFGNMSGRRSHSATTKSKGSKEFAAVFAIHFPNTQGDTMGEPIEAWRQEKIEQLAPGDKWDAEYSFSVFRFKDGWHFYWKYLSRVAISGQDLGRFFDEDHIWEMRNFMAGKWEKGVPIQPPTIEEIV